VFWGLFAYAVWTVNLAMLEPLIRILATVVGVGIAVSIIISILYSMVRGITRLLLITLLMVCLPAMAAIFPSHAQSLEGDTDFSAVDAYVETQMETLKIPGLALAIVQGDQVAYARGYGQAGPDGRPVTPQTPFMIGSTGKSITALAIMQLVEAGQIELDAPVQAYLPWFRAADPQASAQITVRHLLNQTSGFSTAIGRREEFASDLSDSAIENSVRRLADVELVHSPGTTFEYSNVNYNILGLMVQTVSGQSYESYVQEHIFDPLEMRHSFTSQDEAMQDGMATGYVTWFGIHLPKNIPFNRGSMPSGNQICSVEDMAHHLIAQLNDGRYGEVSVLSPEGVAAMHRPAVPTDTPGQSYGMAWYVGAIDGVPAVYHAGDNGNFATYLLMIPEEELGVAVMFNVNGLTVIGGHKQIGEGVMAAIRGKQPQPYKTHEMLPKMIGSVVVPSAVSMLWVAWMVYRFVRRRKQGVPAQRNILWIVWVVVLPLIVDLALLWVLLFGIPTLWELPLSGIAVMFPDMFTLVIGSTVALVWWGLARTVLTLRSVKSQPQAAL
jgi:CubicO group peptidase (beta-lactamase class C family)